MIVLVPTMRKRLPNQARPLAAIAAALLVLIGANQAVAEPGVDRPTHNIWLDIDTANGVGDVDDGLMLIQALHSENVNLIGVSTVFGNTDLAWATHIARDIIDRFADGRTLLVHPGAANADDDASTAATRAMAAALKGGPMTILAVGPVTNVATLIREHPAATQNIESIIVVAGRRPGQRFLTEGQSPDSEPPDFNFELDPDAMRTVLESGVPVVLAPWEVSSQIMITADDLDELAARGGDAGAWVRRTSQYWLERHAAAGKRGFHPYDSLALAWLLFPDYLESERKRVSIDRADPDAEQSGRAFLHARPAEHPDADGVGVTYLHTPKPGLKSELLRLLEDDDPAPPPADSGFDIETYAELLTAVVEPQRGFVDYDTLSSRVAQLDRVVASLGDAQLDGLTDDQRLALMINAYNAFTLKLIVDHMPIDSILDIPAHERWKAQRWRFAGRTVTLDQLEHQVIRVNWDEPRIHFALVCAAAGCPPLRDEPFRGRTLDAQLDDQCRHAHRLTKVVDFDPSANIATLTPLYGYYAQDFGGPDGVYRFAARYYRPLYFALLRGSPTDITFGGYDWSLNHAHSDSR